jgi:hypothetical protein
MVVRVALVIAAFGVTGAIAHSNGPTAWKTALQLRSAALEHRYVNLRRPASNPEPEWLKALQLRGEALDHRYGLGGHVRSAQAAARPDWYEALMERSDVLDRTFRLGRYAGSS